MNTKELENEFAEEVYAHKIHFLLAETKPLAHSAGRETFRGEKVDFIWLDEDDIEHIYQDEADEIFNKVLMAKELEEQLKKSQTKEKRKLKI